MATRKKPQGGGVAALIREAGSKTKLAIEGKSEDGLTIQTSADPDTGKPIPVKPKIFNILEYIESSWGLGMTLYPVQRFLVKLYYHLPLEEKEKTITVKDMLGEKVLHRFTEVEYLKFLYNEGRCNIGEPDHARNQLILAIGRRGGKCATKDTFVYTNKGLIQLGDLGDPDGPEFQPLEIGVAQEGGVRSQSAYFYNGGVKDTVWFETRCRYGEEGTPNHRVRVMGEDGCIQWRRLDGLCEKEYVGIHRTTDLWASDFVTTPTANVRKGYKKTHLPEILDESWAEMLGILVGDGTWGQPGYVEVTVGPYPEWVTYVKDSFDTLFGSHSLVKTPKRADSIRFSSVEVRDFFSYLGYSLECKADTKTIPWAIMQSPKPVVAAFLRGLFETDGGVESGRKVTFSTASSELARELQLLLLNFGIVSRVKSKFNKKYQKNYYYLNLLGYRSVEIFAREIGFISTRKQEALQSYLDKGWQGNKSNTEVVPHQKDWCRRLLESVPKNNGNPACGRPGWRRSLLRKALGNVIKPSSKEELSYPRLKVALAVAREVGADSEIIRHFEEILEADYFFDPIESIGQGRARVYDLNVPEGASFVANGLTNHNTTLSSIFASYEVYRLLNLYNPQAYYGFPNGNRIQLISVATDKDQAGLLFNEVTSHLAKCEYFKPYIASNTQSHILFRTPYDIEKYGPNIRHQNGKFVSFNGKASLRVTFKGSTAKGLRGASNALVIMDEVAHFQDKGTMSAKDIYDAVTPSTATYSPKNPSNPQEPIGDVESRVILISSPLGRSGKFYELYHLAMTGGEGSETKLAIQAPTWEINPTVPASYYKEKYHEDPSVFMTEHGAQFSDRVRGWIERENDLLECIDLNLKPQVVGRPRHPHEMGIDIGLVKDGTCVAITTTDHEGKIVLAYHEYWQAGVPWKESNPHLQTPLLDYCKTIEDQVRLDFDEIANLVEALTKKFYITEGIFDQWNGIPLEQSLLKKGLTQFHSELFQRDLASRVYQNAKLQMFDKRLRLYDYPLSEKAKHSPLIDEILHLQAKQTSKHLVIVEAPETAGYHDDQSDAVMRAIWLTTNRLRTTKHVYGTATAGPSAPAGRMTVSRYQRMRASRHGYGPRTVPKNFRRR